jgi:ubiquinone/menaquinone biosynthesis C-methylase UbiE
MNAKTSFEHHYSVPDPYGHNKWYSERKRIELSLSLLFETGLRFDRGLELACGEGDISKEVMKVCSQLVAVDISENALKRAKALNKHFGNRIQFIEADAYTIEFPENSFDFINGMESLQYTKDRASQVARWIKWLRPGATFCFRGRT